MADLTGPVAAGDYVTALLTGYDALCAVVCAERGVDPTDMALKATRATVKPGDASYEFPFAWIVAIPDGAVVEAGEGSLTTRSRYTAFVADRSADGDVLAARLKCHLLALMRLFLWQQSGDITARLTDFTGTPPYAPDDTTWVGSVGIEIEVTVTEDID